MGARKRRGTGGGNEKEETSRAFINMNIFDVRIYVFILVDSARQSKVIIIINDNERTTDENARTERAKMINFSNFLRGLSTREN